MTGTAETSERQVPVNGPWGRTTLAFHLALFAIAAVGAWTSSLTATVYLPLIALFTTLVGGLVMVLRSGFRSAGGRVVGATILAAMLEAGAALALIAAYSAQNPGWDLS